MSLRAPAVIVGAGLMGRWHADAIRATGGRVAGVVDPDSAKAAALAARHGAAPATDLASLLDGPRRIVHICTPGETHLALALEALNAGADVLCEKPFGASAVEAARILDAAAAGDRLVCPVYQFPFQAGVRRALDALPGLGKLLHVDLVACSAGAGEAPDRRERVALEILPHPLSLLYRVLHGSLGAVGWRAANPAPGEIRITGLAGPTTVGILISMAGRPTRNTLRLVAEGGTVHVDLFHGYALVEGGSVSRGSKIARPFLLAGTTIASAAANLAGRVLRREPAYPGLRELIRRVHAAAAGDEPCPIAPQETLEIARAADAITGLLAGALRPVARPPERATP